MFRRSVKLLSVFILFSIFFLLPLIPDFQLARPKLLFLEIALFVFLFFFILSGVFSEKFNLNLTLLFPLLTLTGFFAIAFLLSQQKYVSISEFKRFLICGVIFFCISSLIDDAWKRKFILLGWMAGCFLSILYGLLQHSGGIWILDVPKMDRVMSTFGNPIFFGAFLVISLPIILGYAFSQRNNFAKIILISIFALGTLALFYTKTRASWISFAISLLLFLLMSKVAKRVKLAIGSLALIFAIVFLLSTKRVWLRDQAHHLIWRDTLKMWIANPTFGTGIGSFHLIFPDYASEELRKKWPRRQFIINDAHNEYLQLLSETGLVGFGIYMWFLVSVFRVGFSFLKSQKRNYYLLLGLLCGNIALLLQNIFSVDMRFIISSFYLFACFGLIISFLGVRKEVFIPWYIKPALLFLLIFPSGILTIGGGGVHIASLIHFNDGKFKTGLSHEGFGLLQALLAPYLARRDVKSKPSFFESKLEMSESIDDLIELAKKYPYNAKIYEKMGYIYAHQRRFRDAVESYKKAIAIDPLLFGVYNNLGNIFFLTGKRTEAIRCYKRSLEINYFQPDAHLNLAKLYYLEGRLKEASEEIDFILRMDGKDSKVLHAKAEALVLLKKMRE